MKIFNLKKILPVLFCFLVFSNTAFSQVVVERSKNKVVIAGVAYYVHQVKKGETAYSISKAYGISVENLTKENPPAVYGINEGQSLRIPVQFVTDAKQADSTAVRKSMTIHASSITICIPVRLFTPFQKLSEFQKMILWRAIQDLN